MNHYVAPNARETQLAREHHEQRRVLEHGTVTGVAMTLAEYREELLREFVELQKDLEAMGDVKVARALQELLDTARGVP